MPARTKVLVVDDHADSARAVATALEGQGAECRVSHDGNEALGLAREYEPDLVFLDVNMPGMDGLALARELRAHPSTRVARLVALTGMPSPELRESADNSVIDDYLLKPASLPELATILKKLKVRRRTL